MDTGTIVSSVGYFGFQREAILEWDWVLFLKWVACDMNLQQLQQLALNGMPGHQWNSDPHCPTYWYVGEAKWLTVLLIEVNISGQQGAIVQPYPQSPLFVYGQHQKCRLWPGLIEEHTQSTHFFGSQSDLSTSLLIIDFQIEAVPSLHSWCTDKIGWPQEFPTFSYF